MRKFFPIILLVILLGAFAWWEYQYRNTSPTLEPEPARAGVSSLLADPIEVDGQNYLIEPGYLVRGSQRDAISALTNADYESVAAADTHLSDEGLGAMIDVYGQPYFYPYVVMSWHEIVNETISGLPLVITYCPLCRSAIAYERTVEDQILEFGTSGLLLDNNLVMYDRETNSLWSQLHGMSVSGEHLGTELQQYPIQEMTFGEFKELYSYGSVLSRNTGHDRDYTQDPYWEYHESNQIEFVLRNFDARLSAKEIVYVEHDGTEEAWAYISPDTNTFPVYWFCWAAAFPGTDLLTDL